MFKCDSSERGYLQQSNLATIHGNNVTLKQHNIETIFYLSNHTLQINIKNKLTF